MTTDLNHILSGVTCRSAEVSRKDLVDFTLGIVDLTEKNVTGLEILRQFSASKYSGQNGQRRSSRQSNDCNRPLPNWSRNSCNRVPISHETGFTTKRRRARNFRGRTRRGGCAPRDPEIYASIGARGTRSARSGICLDLRRRTPESASLPSGKS